MNFKSTAGHVLVIGALAFAALIAGPDQALAGHQPDLTGDWEGWVKFTSAQPKVLLSLEQSGDGTFSGTISLPMQDRHDLPVSNIEVDGNRISFDLSTGHATASFKGRYSEETDTISGDFIQAGATFPFELKCKTATRAMSGK